MIRACILAALALTVCITGSSALIRHVQSGVGCEGWSACYRAMAGTGTAGTAPGASGASDATTVPSPGGAAARFVPTARAAHRASATTVGLLAVIIAFVGGSRLRPRERPAAALALGLTVLLAWLGRYTPHDLPAVTLGNVLGGFLLAASFGWMAARAPAVPASARSHVTARAAALALAVVFAQAYIGVMISARHAVDACHGLACLPSPPFGWDALDPLRAQGSGPDGGAKMLAFVHRLGALAVVLATLRAALFAAVPATRGLAAMLVAGVCVQCALGVSVAVGSQPLGVATAHNTVAAVLVALLAALARRTSANGD